jgi:cell wall-associated NlpC family hydrolase
MSSIDDHTGASVAQTALDVAADYAARGVSYQMGGNASGGGEASDCSHFVNDALQRSGVDVPYVNTAEIATSGHFAEVPANEAHAGDVVVQGAHMGVFTGGGDADGHPIGVQMGNHGAQAAPWGPGGWFSNGGDIRFYRPKK